MCRLERAGIMKYQVSLIFKLPICFLALSVVVIPAFAESPLEKIKCEGKNFIGLEVEGDSKDEKSFKQPVFDTSVKDSPLRVKGEFEGVRVRSVGSAYPAAKAGLYPEDRIVKYAGRAVSTREELTEAIQSTAIGESSEIELLRASELKTVQITPMPLCDFLESLKVSSETTVDRIEKEGS